MSLVRAVCVAWLAAFVSFAAPLTIADQPATETPKGLAAIAVPPGFIVEEIAGPPLIERPMLAAFDDQGRLYVCDSAGVNLRGPELTKNPPHSIRVLEDTDGDGRFDKSTVFADKMIFPQGIVWHDGAVFCSSPPSFWKLTDTDGDLVADEREELVTGFANTGVADDMHGGSLGPDGRIYWCAGRFPHEIHRPDGPVIHKGTAPLILRCRPDGSDLEVVCGSQGNAVGVAFTPEGDMFSSGTFLAPNSMGDGLRDALVHCVDGAEYPVRDRTLKEHKRTGDLLPPLTHLGVSASSDLIHCRAGALGEGSQGQLYSALFNLHKVMRHNITRSGATYTCRNEEFLASSDSDFHPTDVLEDADGSLLVVNTGGWFRIGCPTSQVAKPDVLGAIYRVRRADAKRPDDPRGNAIDWKSLSPEALCERLADARFAVRDRAIAELAKRGPPAVPALAAVLSSDRDLETHCAAIWALTRIDDDAARSAIRVALDHRIPGVRQTAARAAGLHRDEQSLDKLSQLARQDEPPVRREAATALGRIGKPSAVPALLDSLSAPVDRFLEHATIFALIAIDDESATGQGLASTSSEVRRGSLIALDQMNAGKLVPDTVTPLLNPVDPLLRQTALWVISHHAEWGSAMAPFFREWLARQNPADAERDAVREQLLAFAGDSAVQEAIAAALGEEATPANTRLLLLEVIAQAAPRQLPAAWAASLHRSLVDSDEQISRQTVATLRGLPLEAPRPKKKDDDDDDENLPPPVDHQFDQPLVKLALDASGPHDIRVQAAAAVARRLDKLSPQLFDFLIAGLDDMHPPLARLDAAEALGAAHLDDAQLATLSRAIAVGDVLEVPRLLRPFERSSDPASGQSLVVALERSPGFAGLQRDELVAALANYSEEVRQQAAPLFERLNQSADKQRAKLAAVEHVVTGGEIQRGRDLFFGNKKAICATCHAVQGQGGKIGPDLSKIGAIRTPRDLLEAIVLPSVSFARGYEPFTAATTDGRVHTGVITRETSDAIYLYSTDRVENRVPRADIETLVQSSVSIMPEGMEAQLSHQELADLLAFLQSLK